MVSPNFYEWRIVFMVSLGLVVTEGEQIVDRSEYKPLHVLVD